MRTCTRCTTPGHAALNTAWPIKNPSLLWHRPGQSPGKLPCCFGNPWRTLAKCRSQFWPASSYYCDAECDTRELATRRRYHQTAGRWRNLSGTLSATLRTSCWWRQPQPRLGYETAALLADRPLTRLGQSLASQKIWLGEPPNSAFYSEPRCEADW